ncbi:MAG TPA: O-methyltransferase [Sumerlaeia bacterium]|nr:O-methyltransferase [Sumerlaeia bacterium]
MLRRALLGVVAAVGLAGNVCLAAQETGGQQEKEVGLRMLADADQSGQAPGRERQEAKPGPEVSRDRPAQGGAYTSFKDHAPAPKTEAEKNALDVLEDMYRTQRGGMMNVLPEDGRLLRVLTEAANAKHVVEIGTSNGYSGIWFCLALRATGGKLTTFEIDPKRAALARENFKRAGVGDIVTLVEGDAHKEVAKLKGPIDVVFLDADKEGYADYLKKLLPLVRPGGLILAHNTTNTGPQMKDYLEAVTTDPNLETLFLHKEGRGVGVTLKKR